MFLHCSVDSSTRVLLSAYNLSPRECRSWWAIKTFDAGPMVGFLPCTLKVVQRCAAATIRVLPPAKKRDSSKDSDHLRPSFRLTLGALKRLGVPLLSFPFQPIPPGVASTKKKTPRATPIESRHLQRRLHLRDQLLIGFHLATSSCEARGWCPGKTWS